VAIAQSSNGTSPSPKVHSTPAPVQSKEKPGVESNAPENSAKDPDNVQYTAPGDPNANTAAATAAAGTEAGGESTKESPGTEQPGSEASNDDGPGGHADEPGDSNADHQFEGKE
jgi:hypothetical protein